MYKQLIRTSKLLPTEKERKRSLTEVRAEFRAHANDDSNESLQKLMKLAESRLGFLRVITPSRTPGGSSGDPLNSGRFTMRKGELEAGGTMMQDKALKTGGVDPDHLARHKYLLERQHFMHRK